MILRGVTDFVTPLIFLYFLSHFIKIENTVIYYFYVNIPLI